MEKIIWTGEELTVEELIAIFNDLPKDAYVCINEGYAVGSISITKTEMYESTLTCVVLE